MSTRALIIEDEVSAVEYLKQLLSEIDPSIEIIAELPTIADSINWLKANKEPDLIFLDIHLADGSSFSIFNHVNVTCPIIFVTANDQYAIQAFDLNSIAYLLKPISHEGLTKAINKYNKYRINTIDYSSILSKIAENEAINRDTTKKYKQNFLVQIKDKLVPVDVSKIAYIFTESKIVRAVTDTEQVFIMDKNIEELVSMIDPEMFYRANRQFIVNRKYFKEAFIWFNGKLTIKMTIDSIDRIEISKARVTDFKNWIGR
jgi:two-component system LytT family response regulator